MEVLAVSSGPVMSKGSTRMDSHPTPKIKGEKVSKFEGHQRNGNAVISNSTTQSNFMVSTRRD